MAGYYGTYSSINTFQVATILQDSTDFTRHEVTDKGHTLKIDLSNYG